MHSPDRTWWWTGEKWVPAVSTDRTWWWDGEQWAPIPNLPKKRRPLWQRLLLGILIGVATVVSLVAYAYLSGSYHGSLWLDDEQIRHVSELGCSRITAASTDADGDRLARLDRVNEAMIALVDDLWALGEDRLSDDEPALEWVADWERMIAARVAYGHALRDGSAQAFEEPVAKGDPISERMDFAGPDECTEAVRVSANP